MGSNHVNRNDDGHMVIDETFGERRQSIVLVLGRLYLERNILTLDVADISHTLQEKCPPARGWVMQSAVEISDNLRARLLRTSSGSQRHCAEHHDEVATPHSLPQRPLRSMRSSPN